jgi:uncharacterized membrane protein
LNRYLIYALVMFTMTSCTSWVRMFEQPGWTSSSSGSNWSSHTGGGGGSYGGGSGGGGHK